MLIGYARVSTSDQTLYSPGDNLRAARCERLFTDVASGVNTTNPGGKLVFHLFGTLAEFERD